jgi:hypothetical protein
MLNTKVERRTTVDRSQCVGGDQEKRRVLERTKSASGVRNQEIREECDREPQQGEHDPDREGYYDERVFCVVPGPGNRVVPGIKQLYHRTHKTGEQDDSDNYTRRVPLH